MVSSPKYTTAIYAYSPPSTPLSNETKDPQAAVQAALHAVLTSIRQSIEARSPSHALSSAKPRTSDPTRWLLQIRTLRLVVPSQDQQKSSTTRTMYMVRNAAEPDSVTTVIEDPARSAVNISTLASNNFDYFLSTSLLPPLGSAKGRQTEGPSTSSTAESNSNNPGETQQQIQQRAQQGRWIPRAAFAQVEGFTIQDPHADFRISVGTVSARGGTSGAAGSSTGDLVIQLEYLQQPFYNDALAYTMLEEYLTHILPKNSNISDLSAETTSLDWRSLLAVGPDKPELPRWSSRNTAWCLVKMCKMERLL